MCNTTINTSVGKVTLTDANQREELAEKLAITVLFSEFLKIPRQNPIEFSWNRDNLGFKLQYCRTALNSLEHRCAELSIYPNLADCFDFRRYEYFDRYPSGQNLITHISKWFLVLFRCYKESESSYMLNYVTQLIGLVNNALREIPIIKCPSKEEAEIRLKLFSLSKFVLDVSFEILGFPKITKI